LFATIACEVASANLTPASGRQDHTTSPSAGQRSRQQRRLRPSHPAPYVRDDRETPLLWGGMARILNLIWVSGEAKFFLKGGCTNEANH